MMSHNMVLCGGKKERKVGSSGCRCDNGMTVRKLDINWHPNWMTKRIWNKKDGKISTRFLELVDLHINWVFCFPHLEKIRQRADVHVDVLVIREIANELAQRR